MFKITNRAANFHVFSPEILLYGLSASPENVMFKK